MVHCEKVNIGKPMVEKQGVLGTFFWCQFRTDEGLALSPVINLCAASRERKGDTLQNHALFLGK